VTVCVAAICEGSMVVGASDRMLTTGDIQFEPQRPKIHVLTTSIVVMTAGDAALSSEVVGDVRSVVQARVESEPGNWWKVRDVADLYAHFYNLARIRRAENAILAPLGLDVETFTSRQQGLDPGLVRQLANDLTKYKAPTVEVIICGNDFSGPGPQPVPHIYSAYNSNVSCQDSVGFVAIGMGAGHADSHLMFAGHTTRRPFPETLLRVYSAKKRAEVAPGVGSATDVFNIGPAIGSLIQIFPQHLDRMNAMYSAVRTAERRAEARAVQKVTQYVQDILRNPQAPDRPEQATQLEPEEGGAAHTSPDEPEAAEPDNDIRGGT
jgi:hypothetical protein